MCYSQANNKYDSTFLRLLSILLTLPYTVHALTIMLTAAGVIWNTVTSTFSSMHAPHAQYALLPSLKPLSPCPHLAYPLPLDDRELLQGQILSDFRVISRFWEATTAKRVKIDP